jgi:hypothetical protein
MWRLIPALRVKAESLGTAEISFARHFPEILSRFAHWLALHELLAERALHELAFPLDDPIVGTVRRRARSA